MGGNEHETYEPAAGWPEDPVLRNIAQVHEATGQWSEIVDAEWRIVFQSSELLRVFGGGGQELADDVVGHHYLSTEGRRQNREARLGRMTPENEVKNMRSMAAHAVADAGREDTLRQADPALRPLVEEVAPADADLTAIVEFVGGIGGQVVQNDRTVSRVRRADGSVAGSILWLKPRGKMTTLSTMISNSDLGHISKMHRMAIPQRRPTAVMFADLEGSGRLSRTMPTAAYFRLARRLISRADRCVVDHGGLVGRHVGDGTVAFFVAELHKTESAAARAAIEAARAIREAGREAAVRSELDPDDVVLRFGLHWGAKPFVGSITTAGRNEVTALGDEVNEAARIEACATGGRMLVSKDLLEQLAPEDALALDIDPDRITYTPLTELPTATEKARRDAPAIAVCDI